MKRVRIAAEGGRQLGVAGANQAAAIDIAGRAGRLRDVRQWQAVASQNMLVIMESGHVGIGVE